MAVPFETGVRESGNLIAFPIQQYGKEAVLQGALANLGELEPIDCKAFAEANGLDEGMCGFLCKGMPKALEPQCKAKVLDFLAKWGIFHGLDKPPCNIINGQLVCNPDTMPPRPSPGPDPSPIEMGQNFLFYKGDFFIRTAAVRPLLANPGALSRPASALGGTTIPQAAAVQKTSTPKPACGCQTDNSAAAVLSRGVQEGGCK